MKTAIKELNMNEMEQVNGAGVFDWIVVNISLPIYKEIKNVSEKLGDNINNLKDLVEDKLKEVIDNLTDENIGTRFIQGQ